MPISICLFFQDSTINNQHSQEPFNSTCDLSSLDPLCNDSEEILRQLAENPFDVESFFTEFNGTEIKVSKYSIFNIRKKSVCCDECDIQNICNK